MTHCVWLNISILLLTSSYLFLSELLWAPSQMSLIFHSPTDCGGECWTDAVCLLWWLEKWVSINLKSGPVNTLTQALAALLTSEPTWQRASLLFSTQPSVHRQREVNTSGLYQPLRDPLLTDTSGQNRPRRAVRDSGKHENWVWADADSQALSQIRLGIIKGK